MLAFRQKLSVHSIFVGMSLITRALPTFHQLSDLERHFMKFFPSFLALAASSMMIGMPSDRAALPVCLDVVHHQKSVLRIDLVTKSVVGQNQKPVLAQ